MKNLGVELAEVGPEEYAIMDPGSPFLIAFVPVTIAGEPTCHEHTALTWGTAAESAKLPSAPSGRRFMEHRLGALNP